MKKRIFSLLLVIAMLVTVLPVNVFAADECPASSLGHYLQTTYNNNGTHTVRCMYYACGYEDTAECTLGAHQSEYGYVQHYQACTVCSHRVYSDHNYGGWTVTSGYSGKKHSSTCLDCGQTTSGFCSYVNQPYITENGEHRQACSVCGAESSATKCTIGNAEYAGNDQHSFSCTTCDVGDTVACTYGNFTYNKWNSIAAAAGHYKKCSVCGHETESVAHKFEYIGTDGKTTHSAKCKDCGYTVNNQNCVLKSTYVQGETQHWQICSICNTKGTMTNHSGPTVDNKNGTHTVKCDTCKKTATTDCTYGAFEYDAFNGDKGHYKQCTVCGGKTKLAAHTNKSYTPYYDGVHFIECADCGYSMGTGKCEYGAYFNKTADKHSHTCELCNDTVTEAHDFSENNKCPCGAEKHEHAWVVSASGNTITVKCTCNTGTCAYNKNGGTLTIDAVDAVDAVYDGTAKAAKVTNEIDTGRYIDDMYTVSYYKKVNGSWQMSSTPVNAGEYKAEVYSQLDTSKKASVTFKITARTLSVTDAGYEGTYDGKAHSITVNAPQSADITYSLNENGSYSWQKPTFTNVGEYTVYYKVTESSGNYSPAEVKGSETVKISQLDLAKKLNVTAGSTVFTFNRSEWTDGVPHSIKLNVAESYVPGTNDYITVEYSKDGGATWSTTNPTFRDAKDEPYSVMYRIGVKDGKDMSANYKEITGSKTVTIKKAKLPVDGLAGYKGPFDGNWHYSFGYHVNGAYDFSYIYYTGAPWNSWYGDDFTFTFTWTDENGTERVTSFNTANNTWKDADNWPHYKKQNVSNYDEAGHIVSVTIEDNDGNYEPWSGSYSVKIGPAVGPTCSDVETVYDAQLHHLTLMFGIDMDAYDCIEYQVKGENGQWTGEWMHREPDGISSVPSPYEPAYKDVGKYPVKWRVKIDSDMDGQIGGYNANRERENGGAYNSLGSLEIIAPRYEYNTITITPASLTITANDNTITYGDEPAHNGVTINGLKGTDAADTVLDQTGASYTYNYNRYDKVGDYTITPTGIKLAEGNKNYTITFGNGKLTVVPKELGIEWGNTEFVYDGTKHVPSVTVKGIVNNDDVEVIMTGAAKEAGEYNAEITGLDGNDKDNYKLPNNLKVPFTIVRKPVLTVTAKDKTITYGDAPSNNGVDVTGFADGDDESILKGTATYTYNYSQYGNVGQYKITPADLSADGYNMVFVDGKLTVEQKELGILWSDVTVPYNGEPQAPTATATGTVNGDEITLTVKVNVEGEGEAIGVGEYEAEVIGMSGDKAGNYKLPQSGKTIKFSIVKKTVEAPVVSAKDETIRGKNDGGINGLTTEMEYSADGGETWTKVTDPAVELAPGAYQVRYSETDTSKASEPADVTINPGKYLTVTLPNGEGYTTSSDEADTADKQVYNDTFEFTVDIKDGYSKGENFKVTANGEELTPNEDGSYTISGIVEDTEVKVEGVVDNTAPTGTIAVSTHQWEEFVKNITFNIFFKNSQTVTITAEDTGSGIKSIEYIACESVLTEDYVKAIAAGEWKPYSAPFAINPDAKVVVYAKITDKAGNVKFISSDGMVFDGTAPVFNGVEDGGEYNEETKFTVTDDNLDKVTVDGVEVKPDENGNYTLPMDNKEHVLVATDKSGNETKITVNMKEKTAAPVVKPPVPSTGDEGIFLPLMLFMLSGIACVAIIASKKKFRF